MQQNTSIKEEYQKRVNIVIEYINNPRTTDPDKLKTEIYIPIE